MPYLEKGSITKMGLFKRMFSKQDDFDYEDEDEAVNTGNDGASVALGGSNIELKVIKPQEFDQILVAADHLVDGKTVLLSIEGIEKTVCRRMIDFISGVAYALNCNIKKATKDSYFIAPKDVDVSGEIFETPVEDDTFSDI